jgi:DNA repair exonuclease SbcCD nuclease subunit
MKKYLIVCDTHLGIHKSSDVWHQSTIKLFETIVDECHRRNIDTIIHLGDWFDDRKFLNIKTFSISDFISDMLKEFNVYILVGNHDAYYKTNISTTSLGIFKEHKNITIIDTVRKIDDFLVVPWNSLTEDILEKGGKYLLGHLEINTFYTSNTYEFNQSAFEPSHFKNFDLVISGHFHIPSKKNNIIYLGSPFHMSFNDVNSNRGFYIFEDEKLEFLEFTEYPRFVIIDTENEIKQDQIKGNIVKVKFRKDYGTNENNKIIENIQLLEPLQLHIDFSNISLIENNNSSLSIDETENIKLKDHKTIFYDYIDKVNQPNNLKKQTIKKMIESILLEGE